MRVFAPFVLTLTSILAGCASAGAPSVRPVAPAELARLEARALRDSGAIEPQLRLAVAYRSQGRMRDALQVAERALGRWPDSARAALLAGSCQEDLGDVRAARESYARALRTTTSSRLRSDLRSRLVLLQRRETQAYVKDALTREAELASTPPRPHTVAVFPLGVATPGTVLEPLGRALAAMLITDLGRTDRLTVLDRTVVQMLADEIRLAQLGYVDERTAARGGRLLGAERVVQGSLASSGDVLRLEAAVVSLAAVAAPAAAPRPAAPAAPGRRAAPAAAQGKPAAADMAAKAAPATTVQGSTRVSDSGRLDELFDVEKRLALKIYAAAGVELTPAERADVTARRTENLQALLAYGRGLMASDAGDPGSALRFFDQAARLDPSFTPARAEAASARAMVAAGQVSTQQLASSAQKAGASAQAAASSALSTLPLARDAVAELLGTEGATARTAIELVIRRPGDAP